MDNKPSKSGKLKEGEKTQSAQNRRHTPKAKPWNQPLLPASLPNSIIRHGLFSYLPLEAASLLSATNQRSNDLLKSSVRVSKLVRHIKRGERAKAEAIIRKNLLKKPDDLTKISDLLLQEVWTQAIVSQLVQQAIKGEQADAEAILRENDLKERNDPTKIPDLLSRKAWVTDYSGRTFEMTALQAARWALDRHMWERVLKYLPAHNAREQLAELAKMPTYTVQLLPENAEEEMKWEDSVLYVKKVEITKEDKTSEMVLEYCVKAPTGEIKSGTISAQELGQHIEKRPTGEESFDDKIESNSEMEEDEEEKKEETRAAPMLTEAELREKELNEFESRLAAVLIVTTRRNHTAGYGSQFDATPLLKAYKIYIDAYNAMNTTNRFDWKQLDKLWLDIAWQQRFLPASWWKEFFRRKRSFDPTLEFNGMLHSDFSFLPLKSFSGLGFDFGLIRRRRGGCGGCALVKGADGVGLTGPVDDTAALGRFFEVKNTKAEQLYQQLNPNPAPRPR